MIVRIGAISVANSFSNFGFILSGPAALFGFMLVSNFRTPFSVISSSSAEGYWPDILQQVLNSSGLYVSLVEKVDWNFYSGCLLGLLGESVVFHNLRRGATPLLSDLLYLMYVQKRFMLLCWFSSSSLGVTMLSIYFHYSLRSSLCIILFTSLNFDVILGSADFFFFLYNLSRRRMSLRMFGVIHGRLSFLLCSLVRDVVYHTLV